MVFHNRLIAAAFAAGILLLPVAGFARVANGSIAGTVRAEDGTPVASAVIMLEGSDGTKETHADEHGGFVFSSLTPGVYSARVRGPGFDQLAGRTVEVRAGVATAMTLTLTRSASSLVTIGNVRTRASGEALSTSSAPSLELNAQQYAARGYASVADMLVDLAISATAIRAAGGGPASPVVVALRGPDPTETLIELDGHAMNSGGTGAFDLSLIDPSALSSVQIVYGISPSSLVGPNTIDGAINIRTLDPTTAKHSLIRFTSGSFAKFGVSAQTTGTDDRVGYAFAIDHSYNGGEVNQSVSSDGTNAWVGSATDGDSALAKLQLPIERGNGYLTVSLHSQSENRDLSAALTTQTTQPGGDPTYNVFAGSRAQGHNSGAGVDAFFPLGRLGADGIARTTVLVRHLSASANQSIFGPAVGTSPYLYNDRDSLTDDTVEIDRTLYKGMLSAKFALRDESLDTEVVDAGATDQSVGRCACAGASVALDAATTNPTNALNGLAQQQRSAILRYTTDPTPKLHYTVAGYLSNFSSFGTSFDPRFGFVWTPAAQSALRLSAGTTFQSPQLPELYVPPALPPPGSNGYVNVGNPNLKADHATDYDLGFEHIFPGSNPSRVSLDFYRSNVRTPSQRYYPALMCPPAKPTECLSFPINVGGAVYRGMEVTLDRSLGHDTSLRAAYSVNSSFATTVSREFQNGTIVPGEQFQGVPLHKALIEFAHAPSQGLGYTLGAAYEDAYNELNRPQFATLHAGMSYSNRRFEVGIYGTNLTNVYDDRFTLAGAGIPYAGANGPIPTDAYSLQGRAFQVVLTERN